MDVQSNLEENTSDVAAIVTAMTDDEKYFLKDTLHAILADDTIAQIIVCYEENNEWLSQSIELYLKDSRIELLSLPMMNIGAVRNRAVQLVKQPWVTFCDGDDVWMPNKTSQQRTFANKKMLDFVGAGHYLTNEDGQIQTYGFSMFIPMPSTWLVKTEVMNKFPFNENLTRRSDGDWWIRTQNKIKKGKYFKVLLKYRVRLQSVSMLSCSKKRKVNMVRFAQVPVLGSLLKGITYIVWLSTKYLPYIWLRKWEKQI